jgi:monooxygenase
MGGTWDLFRYPGVRSDSDMYTLGYRFRPWRDNKAMADGPVDPQLHSSNRRRVWRRQVDSLRPSRAACLAWSPQLTRWTVEAETGPDKELVQLTCNFIYLCTGYYDYDSGYTPEWPGVVRFRGTIVHPQKWPEDLDYAGKRVVVIGSGATAVTLVPAMAERAAHVTMLQRSPSYIVSRPAEDKLANLLRRFYPIAPRICWSAGRMCCRERSSTTSREIDRKFLSGWLREACAIKSVRNTTRSTSRRRTIRGTSDLCLVPDADLFRAIRDGRVSVVTDQIETFTKDGLLLKSGERLDADIVVTATGLVLKLFSGMQLVVDGAPVEMPKTLVYKGMMFSDVPNLAFAIGYTNASWTLKCDLIAEYVCRLLNHMDHHGYNVCTPRVNDPNIEEEPVIDFNSGYVLRALDSLPRQGSKTPWRLHQNYVKDLSMMRYGRVEDGTMEFKSAPSARSVEAEAVTSG